MLLRSYFKYFFLLIGCSIAFLLFYLFTPIIHQKEGIVYYLHPGTSKREVIQNLVDQGIITHRYLFTGYAYFTPRNKLKAGEYYFPYRASFFSIWHQLTHSVGLYYRSFTLVPGWTFKQFCTALQHNYWLKQNDNACDKSWLIKNLSINSPEGLFFPDTYYFTRGETPDKIMKRASKLMQKRLNTLWLTKAENLPYNNPYQALIVASMIEKEAFLEKEKKMIASVLVNRLRKDIPLQIDATVIYALGEQYDGALYKKQLQIDSVYNTYQHKGLPPTPIAYPSLSSIVAALHPDNTDYYYYVAKGDGSHQFSRTLAAHDEAIKEIKLVKENMGIK